MLEFNIENQSISRVDRFKPATDSVDYLTAKFNFLTDDWTDKLKKALFRSGTASYEAAINSSGVCTIPWEVLVSPENKFSVLSGGCVKIFVSVVGTVGTVTLPTKESRVELSISGLTESLNGAEPTPSIYQQFIDAIKTDQTYNPESKNAQSGVAVDMAIKEAIQDARLEISNEISIATGDALQNHDIYFETVEVIEQGLTLNVITLKAEYRGKGDTTISEHTVSDNGVDEVGSDYDELPEVVKIPTTINGVTVGALSPGLFLNNERIKTVVLPSSVIAITTSTFQGCKNLQSIHNTTSITTISKSAFEGTPLREAIFPNVKNIYDNAFKSCSLLKVAHFGGTGTRIRSSAFNDCCSLERLTGCSKVNRIDAHALFYTYHLKETDIGIDATDKKVTVYRQGIQGCAFNFEANGVTLVPYEDKFCTREQFINIPTWKDNIIPVTETRINPINRTFAQGAYQWKERLLYGFDFSGGDARVLKPIQYRNGCVVHSFTNALFGILKSKGENLPYIPYSTDENIHTIEKEYKERFGENVFADFINWGEPWGGITVPEGKLYKIVDTGSKYAVNPYAIIEYLAREKMADILTIEQHYTFDGYNDNYTYNDVNNIYQALLDGKYVMLGSASSTDSTLGHYVLAYGIEATDNPTEPNILVLDTGLYHSKTGVDKPIKYKLPLHYFSSTKYSMYLGDSNNDGVYDSWVTYNLKDIPDCLEYAHYVIVSPKN